MFRGRKETNFLTLVSKYFLFVRNMPVYQGMSWAPTWKSLPNPFIDPKTGKKHYSCFMSLWMELTAFYRHYRAEGRSKI